MFQAPLIKRRIRHGIKHVQNCVFYCESPVVNAEQNFFFVELPVVRYSVRAIYMVVWVKSHGCGCAPLVVVPVPACVKHDMHYGVLVLSLQLFDEFCYDHYSPFAAAIAAAIIFKTSPESRVCVS